MQITTDTAAVVTGGPPRLGRASAEALAAAGGRVAAWQPHMTVPGGPTPGLLPPQDGEGAGPPYAAKAAARYFNDRAGSIHAGTNEIQRNILWGALNRRAG